MGNGELRTANCKNKERPGVAHEERPSAQLSHALRVRALQESGCRFGLNGLTPGEWIGLEALREWRAEAEREAIAEAEKEK